MIRYIFRCTAEACGHIWAHDYEEPDERWKKPRRHILIAGLPKSFAPEDDKIAGCPACKSHKRPTMGKISGKLSTGVKCDERCTQARTASCTCSCGGANHGRAFLPSVSP